MAAMVVVRGATGPRVMDTTMEASEEEVPPEAEGAMVEEVDQVGGATIRARVLVPDELLVVWK
jgi:hypothetical protein